MLDIIILLSLKAIPTPHKTNVRLFAEVNPILHNVWLENHATNLENL